MGISEQVNEVIDNLAEKLGVAVERLYPMLIKQAQIDGIMGVIWSIVCITVCVLGFIVAAKAIKNPQQSKQYDLIQVWSAWTNTKIAVGAIAAAISLIVFVFSVNQAITALANPEWYSLQKLLSYLSN